MDTGANKNGFANTATIERLQQRLNEPQTVQSIDHLLDRIDTLEKAVEKLTVLLEQGPGLTAMAVDIIDENYQKAAAKGVNIEQRLQAGLQIAEKLTDPKMVEKLNQLFVFLDQVPGMIAMTTDLIDEGYQKAREKGIDVEHRFSLALQLADQLTTPRMINQLNDLVKLSAQVPGLLAMSTDIFDEEMKNLHTKNIDFHSLLELAQHLSQSVGEAQHMPPTKVSGIFSMLRTMKDADRQKAIGFIMNIAKAFGQKL